MDDFGLVSIITPLYNCAPFIEDTIKSVLAQSYQNWEMLIQDDCSTDGSYDLALRYAQIDSRIKVEKNQTNSGAAITRNKAIIRSKGEWLAFLDGDDLWDPSKLDRQLKFMHKNGCDFSFTEYEHIDEDNNPLMYKAKAKRKINYNLMLFHCWTGCLTVMYKQDSKIYGPDVKSNNDYALFLKVLKTKNNAMGMQECLAFYRIRKKSVSSNKFHKIKPLIEVLNKYNNINILISIFLMFTNVFIKKIYKYKKLKISGIRRIRDII